MSGMDELIAWLRGCYDREEQRLAEDERVALAATAGPWWHNPGAAWLDPEAFEAYDLTRGEEFVGYGESPFSGCIAATGPGSHPQSMADAEHIARHDPARELADVERGRRGIAGKRALIDEILQYEAKIDGEWGCCHSAALIGAGKCPEIRPGEIRALRLLAQEFDGEAGWREEWRP